MRLARIEIQGFKSFADRTAIKIDGDIISIVGPNGCGKSNIADAVRWAMGEQSVKRLRAGDMGSVIFSGSETRGPMSMAEVTLTFENTGRCAHPLYSGFNEVSIKRRIYFTADGCENEYYINSTLCRLKDVQEFLSSIGVGSKNYSIVEQGSIGWIVISRPEDKRGMIDEAAGISIYKSRISGIQRKIDRTKANLQRLSDIIREIEGNLSNLRRQAQKAKRFQKYQEELRQLELHRASVAFLELTLREKSLRGRIGELSAKKVEIEGGIAGKESEKEELLNLSAEKQEAYSKAEENFYRTENLLFMLKEQRKHLATDVENLKEKERANVEAIAELGINEERLKEELAVLEARRRELESELSARREKFNELLGKLESLKAKQEHYRRLREESRKAILRITSQIGALKEKVERNRKTDETLGERIGELSSLLRGIDEKQIEADVEIRGKMKQKKQIECRWESLVEERSRKDRRRQQIEGELSQVEARLKQIEARISRLQSEIELSSREAAGFSLQIKKLRDFCRQASLRIVSDCIECDEEFRKPLYAAIGRFLFCAIVEGSSEAARVIDESKRFSIENFECIISAGRTSGWGGGSQLALNLEKSESPRGVEKLAHRVRILYPEVEETIRSLIDGIYVVDDLDTALRLWEKRRGERGFVTKAGQLVTRDGAILTGGGVQKGVEIIKLESGAAVMKAQLNELFEEKALVERELESLRSVLRREIEEFERLGELIHDEEKDIVKIQQEISAISSRLYSLQRQKSDVELSLRKVQAEKRALKQMTEEIEQKLPVAFEHLSKHEQIENEVDKNLESLTAVVEHEMIEKGAVSSSIESYEREMAELDVNVGRIKASLANASRKKNALEQEMSSYLREQGRKLAEIFLKGQEYEDKTKELKELAVLKEQLRHQIEDLKFTSGQAEVEIKALRKALAEVEKEMLDYQTELVSVEGELKRIAEGVKIRWHLDMSEVLHSYHAMKPPGDDEEERANQLRRLLEKMGPVNLLAIEDYRRTEENYTFHVNQKKDLEEALEKFSKAIAKLNREYKKKFIGAFNAINENFKKIFPILFCGGHGYLELTEPSNILTTGVEIKAQPPGKKLSCLSVMSGGEKALTAIAFIFSIFQFCPAPFCLLDEVDSPLDEVNVKRFNDLLKKMASNSQFILVTHSKITMENSDILYGVTMQEPGISRIISTRIRKLQEQAGLHRPQAEVA